VRWADLRSKSWTRSPGQSFWNTFLIAALLVTSMCNATWGVWKYVHWPVLISDDWAPLEADLAHAKVTLSGLPDRHIEYRIEDAPDTYDQIAYYKLQSVLAPIILQHDPVGDGFVLVEFGKTKAAKPLSDLILVEDFGNGFALYRRH